MKYRCIDAHRSEFALGLMCRALSVSRSGYYAWKKREPSQRRVQDRALLRSIRDIYLSSKKRYGSPRVHNELRTRGTACGRGRVARLMRTARLRGVAARRRKPKMPTVDRSQLPNLLNRDFGTGALNRAWASDITYVRTAEGWLFLAVVIDLGSRRVVGWAMRGRADVDLVIKALDMAISTRQPPKGLIHHADRGMHYTNARFKKLLWEHGLEPSYSRLGNCWDNAVVESFFHSLKTEQPGPYPSRREARAQLFEFIEVWYNRQRQHTSLGNVSPVEFEACLQRRVH